MMRSIAIAFAIGSAALYAQPAISTGGIVNHFSYAAQGLPNANIAQGSMFDIYGTNLGPKDLAQFSGFPIPASIAGTSVQVTVGGVTTDAYLFFVQLNQIVAVLPSKTPAGNGTLTVTVSGQKSSPAPITVTTRSVGILSLNQAGNGPALMQMPSAGSPPPQNSLTATIAPKGIGVFYGTGAGPVTFDDSRGAPSVDLSSGLKAFVGGIEAKLLFAGRVPGLVGLDQFNVEIPDGVSGCYVPVMFLAGAVVSNYTTISVSSDGGPCSDPITSGSLPEGNVKAAGILLGRVNLKLTTGQEIVSDIASASFSNTDYSKIVRTPQLPYIQLGSCFLQNIGQSPSGGDTGAVTYLDAGPVFTVKGPNGSKVLTRFPTGYSAQLGSTPLPGQVPVPSPPYLSPGVYTADNGAGSASVGPFVATLTVPDFAWTNQGAATKIDRASGVEVTWSGGDPGSLVYIGGSVILPRVAGQSTTGVTFSCTEKVSAGKFTVPPGVLLALPPSTTTAGVSSGQLLLSTTGTVDFTVTGIDKASIYYNLSVTRSADYK